MLTPIIDHFYITVMDFEQAEDFYDRFLPILGFEITLKEPTVEYGLRIIKYHHHNLTFAIAEPDAALTGLPVNPNRPGTVQHIAFRAPSRTAVDEAFQLALACGAEPHQDPRLFTKQCVDFYSCAVCGPEGFVIEIIHFLREEFF